MTEEEYGLLCEALSLNGFHFATGALCGSQGYWYKGFGKSKQEEGRSNYQLMFLVYDFSEFSHRSEYLKTHPRTVQAMVMVSRTVSERTDLLMTDGVLDIPTLEKRAESFFAWCEENLTVKIQEYGRKE